jgi:hypothetical protein
MGLLKLLFGRMCEFSKKCEYYDKTSPTCNENGGIYYIDGYCGKYRRLKGWH